MFSNDCLNLFSTSDWCITRQWERANACIDQSANSWQYIGILLNGLDEKKNLQKNSSAFHTTFVYFSSERRACSKYSSPYVCFCSSLSRAHIFLAYTICVYREFCQICRSKTLNWIKILLVPTLMIPITKQFQLQIHRPIQSIHQHHGVSIRVANIQPILLNQLG